MKKQFHLITIRELDDQNGSMAIVSADEISRKELQQLMKLHWDESCRAFCVCYPREKAANAVKLVDLRVGDILFWRDPEGNICDDGTIVQIVKDDEQVLHKRGVQVVQDAASGFNEQNFLKEMHLPIYWLQTHSGKRIDLINPTPEMVDIEDIAHALSMICRFNGHCRDFYSVAEHSVMAEALGSQMMMRQEAERSSKKLSVLPKPTSEFVQKSLELLLHDAAEAYIGDFTAPLKHGLDSIGEVFPPPEMKVSKLAELEARWQRAIGQAFGLGDRLANPSELVQQADDKVLAIEVTTLFHPVQFGWWETRSRPRSGEMMLQCWSPAEARRQFIGRFRALYETLYSKTGWSEVGEAGTPADEGGEK
jgi:hypothetical protein